MDDFSDVEPSWRPPFGADDLAPDASAPPAQSLTPPLQPFQALRTPGALPPWFRENAPTLIAAGSGVLVGILVLRGRADWKSRGIAIGAGAAVTLIALRILRR